MTADVTPLMIPSLRDHLSADIAWLTAEEDDPDWRFGPWPALANFPNWIARFADYGNATLLSAMVAATEVTLPAWYAWFKTDPDFANASLCGGLPPPEQLALARRWIAEPTETNANAVRGSADLTVQTFWHDMEYEDQWLSQSYSDAMWTIDAALHCVIAVDSLTNTYGLYRTHPQTPAMIAIIGACDSLRCRDTSWGPAIQSVVQAIRSELLA